MAARLETVQWEGYDPGTSYCELVGRNGSTPETQLIRDRIGAMTLQQLKYRARAAERELYNLGITFTVYTERDAVDRILPFDLIPRVLTRDDWQIIESGVVQRVQA